MQKILAEVLKLPTNERSVGNMEIQLFFLQRPFLFLFSDTYYAGLMRSIDRGNGTRRPLKERKLFLKDRL